MSFGEFIKEKRIIMNINQRELANMIGVDYSYISKIESDKNPSPSEDTLKKLATILEIDFDLMITMAGKVSEEIKDIILKNPGYAKLIRFIDSTGMSIEQIENKLAC